MNALCYKLKFKRINSFLGSPEKNLSQHRVSGMTYVRVRKQVIFIIHAVGHTVVVLRLSQKLPLQGRAGPDVHKGGLQVVLAEQGVCVAPDGGRWVERLQCAR